MGNYLKKPITDEAVESGRLGTVNFASNTIQGWRQKQEDVVIVEEIFLNCSLFSIADGHAGASASLFLKDNLKQAIADTSSFQKMFQNRSVTSKEIEFDLKRVFDQLDQRMWKENITAGSTLNAVITTTSLIIMINCGDTKSFLVRDGKVHCETIDHKPENENEKERIHRTGGFLKNGRINGKLNVSRAFGDFALKMNQTPLSLASFQIHQKDQPVICEPDIQILERSSTDNFIILGCDGIFDVLNSTQLLQMTFDRISIHESTTKLTSEIIKTCLAKDSKDNLSVIIIEFKQFPKFNPSIFHADVELDARIFSSIEDYITELNIDELCLEDIFIQLLEDKSLIPPPGAGMYLKFDIVREYISKNYPEIMEDYDSEGEDGEDDIRTDPFLSTPGFRTEQIDDIDSEHEGDIDSSQSSTSE